MQSSRLSPILAQRIDRKARSSRRDAYLGLERHEADARSYRPGSAQRLTDEPPLARGGRRS